jgi:hypothetical protein
MTIRVYRSTDAGAASLTLNNTAGKLLAILDACLVNGYAVGTVSSITRSGTTATITFSAAHGLLDRGNYVTIAGADQAEYNGEFELIPATSTTATFTVSGSPATPATGTITATKTGAGWTKPYSGTNKAAFLQGSGGNGHYLRVDDTGTTQGRVVGYESMSDVDTGSGAFPTNTQQSGGLYCLKTNGATAVKWVVVATSSYFFFYADYFNDNDNGVVHFFGHFESDYYQSDAYNTFIAFYTSTSTSNNGLPTCQPTATGGQYIARAYNQSGTALNVRLNIPVQSGSNLTMGSSAFGTTYPDAITNKLLYSETFIKEGLVITRGKLPLLLCPLHSRPLSNFDTFDGAGDLNGYKILVLTIANSGQIFIRISGPDFV